MKEKREYRIFFFLEFPGTTTLEEEVSTAALAPHHLSIHREKGIGGKEKKKKFPIFIQLLYLCARLSDSLDIEEEERREDKEIWENDTTVYECVCDR